MWGGQKVLERSPLANVQRGSVLVPAKDLQKANEAPKPMSTPRTTLKQNTRKRTSLLDSLIHYYVHKVTPLSNNIFFQKQLFFFLLTKMHFSI